MKRLTMGIAALALGLGANEVIAGPPLTRDQAIEYMQRPGSWLEADGAMLPDGTLEAKDLEVYGSHLKGELEDIAITGAIANINRTKSTMRVLGYTVTWDGTTTLKDENKKQILSSKLQDGMGVKVQGSLGPNGVFKATKIKLAGVKVVNGKQKEPKQKIFGPVTVLDAKNGRMRIMDTIVTLRPDAKFIEVIAETQTTAK